MTPTSETVVCVCVCVSMSFTGFVEIESRAWFSIVYSTFIFYVSIYGLHMKREGKHIHMNKNIPHHKVQHDSQWLEQQGTGRIMTVWNNHRNTDIYPIRLLFYPSHFCISNVGAVTNGLFLKSIHVLPCCLFKLNPYTPQLLQSGADHKNDKWHQFCKTNTNK